MDDFGVEKISSRLFAKLHKKNLGAGKNKIYIL